MRNPMTTPLSRFHISPETSRRIVASLMLGIVSSGAGAPFASAAQADASKPVAPSPSVAALGVDYLAWRQLRDSLAPLEKTNPGEAALQYRDFLRRNPDMQPRAAIAALEVILDIYEDRLHDMPTAAAIRAWAMQKYASAPDKARLLPFSSPGARAWRKLHDASAEMEQANPAQAALGYWQFLQARPDLEPRVAVEAAGVLITLYSQRLNDAAGAAAVRKWALHKYARHTDLLRGLPTAPAPVAKPEASVTPTVAVAAEMGSPSQSETSHGEAKPLIETPKAADLLTVGQRNVAQSVTGNKPVVAASLPRTVAENSSQAKTPEVVPAGGQPATQIVVVVTTQKPVAAPRISAAAAIEANLKKLRATSAASFTVVNLVPGQAGVVGNVGFVPLAARQALQPVAIPVTPLPANVWKVPATALLQVNVPTQTWTQEMLDEQARRVALQMTVGPRLAGSPSFAQKTAEQKLALRQAYAAAAAHARTVANLTPLFDRATQLFWTAEPRFNNEYNPVQSLPALEPSDPQTALYRRAAASAEAFLLAQARNGRVDRRTPVMIYFAAMCYSRLNEHEKAIYYIDRMLNEYPDYRRARLEGSPELDRPVRGNLLHLKLYHTGQLANLSLTDAVKTACTGQKPLELLATVVEEGAEATKYVAPAEGQSIAVELEFSSPTPDQLRAAALPTITQLVARANDALLPSAIKTEGAKPVREYLRGLTRNNGPFASYASFKLISIDRDIVTQYRTDAKKAWDAKQWGAARAAFAVLISEYAGTDVARQAKDDMRRMIVLQYKDEAAVALAAKNFDAAKGSYRQLIAEYGDSDDAIWAEAQLKEIVPIAVTYYKEEGTRNFRPGQPDQHGVPQSKGREFFEKMYREDPEGPQASYALYYWSRALGTEGKIAQAIPQLKQLLAKFPDSDEAARTLYLLGFYHAGKQIKSYDVALAYLAQVSQKYPSSPEAAEALWLSAFTLRFNLKRNADAIACLEQLKKQCPLSPRCKFVDEVIGDCRKSM